MTTHDPKYKHKPSEKHTLEEVLKSLQDLIRNDLLDNDLTAADKSGAMPVSREPKPSRESGSPVREDFAPVNPAAGPVNLDAVMRSLKDLVSNELSGDAEPAATGESSLSRTDDLETSEDLTDESAPLDEELTASGAPSPVQTRDLETRDRLADESVPPDEELTPTEASPPARTEEHDALEVDTDEFVPLDEELTFEESMKLVPPPVSEPAMPEVPGEISAEILSEQEPKAEPENALPPPVPAEEPETNMAPGTQQQLMFEETPPEAAEPVPSAPEPPAAAEHEPGQATDGASPEMTQETAAQDFPDVSGDALPTIDVEENFDDSAYLEAEARLHEASSDDTQVTQEIILSALGASLEPETPPPAGGETRVSTENIVPESEPGTDSGKPKIKLEIAHEPTLENLQNIPSVDFDVVEFEPSREQPPSSEGAETAAPSEASFDRELTLDPGSGETPSTPTEPESGVPTGAAGIPDIDAIPSVTSETDKPAPPAEPAAPEKPESFNLDDIPVLHEVVAPPAGSALAGGPVSPPAEPSLPAPDRARDIVVRAVAKLNVEMRKSGGAGLDTKTILRLQQLIRRELEKDGEKS